MNLDQMYSEQIARLEGVKPEDVTLEYIRKRRYERRYLPADCDQINGLKVISLQELEDLEHQLDAACRSWL